MSTFTLAVLHGRGGRPRLSFVLLASTLFLSGPAGSAHMRPAGTPAPAGTVVSQSPPADFDAASLPVTIGTRIAGTFADASGHSAQSHLFYAANAGVWWLLTLTSGADSPGGTNHIVKAYRSSGPDLATATWSAAADSPGASAFMSANCSSCTMAGGRALAVAYLDNAPVDVVHAEVAMASDGQNGLVAHIRAKVTATSIAWESWTYHDEGAAQWTLPRAPALGASTGKYIHSAGPILQQEVDANVRRSTNPDAGVSWVAGFSPVSVVDNSMIHQSNSLAFAPLANNVMLAVFDNGGGSSCGYNCFPPGSVAEPNLTNLGYKRSNPDGSWPGVPVGGQAAGDGKVFSTEATIDHNDWALIASAAGTARAFRRNAAGTAIDAAAYNAATNTWTAFTAPPAFGAGQAFKKTAGLFGAWSDAGFWLFVINTDAANSILFSAYDGTGWTPWATVPGTGSGPHDRKFLSGYPIVRNGQIGLIWTEGSTQYDVVTTSFSVTPPDTTPPDVSIVTPASGSTVSGPVGVSVTASDNTALARVQFQIDGVDQGAPQTAPAFGLTWDSTSVSNGSHSITAVATDAAGNSNSATSTVTVTNVTTVPDVVNLTEADATGTITNAHLTVGTVTTAQNPSVALGSVTSQDPVAGGEAPYGAAVALVVSSGVPVPQVVGQTEAEARASITGVTGLSVGAVTRAASATVPEGSVISQNPAGNTSVTGGTAVELTVSSGRQNVSVPSVVGLTQAAANAAITTAGLIVGIITTDSNPSTPIGSVVSQSVPADSAVPVGSSVDLVVSSGVTVPHVVGQTETAARALIGGVAGLSVGAVTTAFSSTVPSGNVIGQNPAGNTNVSGGASVALTVSSGPQPVPVPNVVGLTQTAASMSLTNAGLAVGGVTSAPHPSVPIGLVAGQGAAAGSLALPGTRIDLILSTGVTVPNVVGQTESAARALISGVAGLSVGAVTTTSSSTAPSGTVIGQNPAGNTAVSGGTSVALVVSSGPPPATPAGPTVDKVITTNGRGTRTTAGFSTSAPGELLVAFVASDGPAASRSQSMTVTGAGLSWTLVRRANTQFGTSEVWVAVAANQLTGVTVRSTQSSPSYDQSLTVVAFRNASGVGASASANAASGAPSVSLTTTAAGSLVYGVGNDWDRAVARTLGSNQTMVNQWVDTSVGDTFWVQRIATVVATSGTIVRINDTAPTTDRWNLVAVEIRTK